MQWYWSQSSYGFYADTINDSMPDDALAIPTEDHDSLLAALNSGQIVIMSKGRPVAVDRPVSAPTVDDLRAYAARKRYTVETGGIVVNGASIDTDRASQSMITGAYAYAQANPDAQVMFKASSGWVQLSAAQVISIATAVGAHVQAAFTAECAVDAAISAGSVADYSGIDAWEWPA